MSRAETFDAVDVEQLALRSVSVTAAQMQAIFGYYSNGAAGTAAAAPPPGCMSGGYLLGRDAFVVVSPGESIPDFCWHIRWRRATDTPKEDMGLLCSVCGKAPANKCGGCMNITYCSRACQVAHWRTHKPLCKPSPEGYMKSSLATQSAMKVLSRNSAFRASILSRGVKRVHFHVGKLPELPAEMMAMLPAPCVDVPFSADDFGGHLCANTLTSLLVLSFAVNKGGSVLIARVPLDAQSTTMRPYVIKTLADNGVNGIPNNVFCKDGAVDPDPAGCKVLDDLGIKYCKVEYTFEEASAAGEKQREVGMIVIHTAETAEYAGK